MGGITGRVQRVTPLSGPSSSWSGNLSWTHEGRAWRKLGVAEGVGLGGGREPRAGMDGAEARSAGNSAPQRVET